MVEGSNGKLYGMTFSGGTSNVGVVFMFNINTMTYSNLVNFNGSNGMYPLGSLMKTNNGKLYGMTYYGGNHGAGIIFYIDTISNALTKVFDFNYPRGITPNGTLHQAADGNLYGLAEEGGTSLLGTAFKFNPLTNTYVDIFNFSTQHYAINPVAELISY